MFDHAALFFPQVIPSWHFIPRQQPQENMNPRWYIHWCHTSEAHNRVKRLNRISSLRFLLPNDVIIIIRELNSTCYLQELFPQQHQPLRDRCNTSGVNYLSFKLIMVIKV